MIIYSSLRPPASSGLETSIQPGGVTNIPVKSVKDNKLSA